MTKAPAFQLYAQDFLVGTADMTAEEVGGYMRLLCYQWVKGGVPANDETLCKLSGCTVAAITAVKGKFSVTKNPAILRNKKLERVRRDLAAFRQRQSQKAVSSWKKRKSNNGKPLAPHEPEACSSPSSSSSVLSTHTHTGGERRLHGIPSTVEEVIAEGEKQHPKVSEARCRKFWAFYEGQRQTGPNGDIFWMTSAGGIVTHWRTKLTSFEDNGGARTRTDANSGYRPNHNPKTLVEQGIDRTLAQARRIAQEENL